jgi:ADP-ribose pyrophosphatase YjhB (NUDIX family)
MSRRKNRKQGSAQSIRGTIVRSPPKPGGFSAAEYRVILALKPEAAPQEIVEDVALFSRSSREKLSESLQAQSSAVANALESIHKGSYDDALERLKEIPHNSVYADWRLFARGLMAFYRDDIDGARKNWERLDAQRRPFRIANTLLAAEGREHLGEPPVAANIELISAAKTLRERTSLVDAARKIERAAPRNKQEGLTQNQVHLLATFYQTFMEVDPDFVMTVSQACVRLATFQSLRTQFERVKVFVRGPREDPHWHFLSVAYYTKFDDTATKLTNAVDGYIQKDLPQVLPPQIQPAMASHLLFVQAENIIHTGNRSFFFRRRNAPDVLPLLSKATELYPRNRLAHLLLISELEQRLDDAAGNKQEAELTLALVGAKEKFVAAYPEEVAVTLWLIDHYLEEGEDAKAEPLVQALENLRLEDPLAKAIPFKLKIRSAFAQSKRKSSLGEVSAALDAAEAVWPNWLSKDWVPYLRAALDFRRGNPHAFSQMPDAAEADSSTRAKRDMMCFAALQHMNVAGADLRPFRDAVELYFSKAKTLPLQDLFFLGSFLWDLKRCGLQHGAYRIQSSRLGKIITSRLSEADLSQANDSLFCTLDWVASHDFWSNINSHFFNKLIVDAKSQPRLANCLVGAALRVKVPAVDLFRVLGNLLTDAARTEKDPFYRYQFSKTAAAAQQRHAELQATMDQRFVEGFGNDEDDEYEDDEYEDDEYEDDEYEDDEYEDDEYEDDEYEDDEYEDYDEVLKDFDEHSAESGKVDPGFLNIIKQLDPTRIHTLIEKLQRLVTGRGNSFEKIGELVKYLTDCGVPYWEAMKFVSGVGPSQIGPESTLDPPEPSVGESFTGEFERVDREHRPLLSTESTLDANARRAARKHRNKVLNSRKKR